MDNIVLLRPYRWCLKNRPTLTAGVGSIRGLAQSTWKMTALKKEKNSIVDDPGGRYCQSSLNQVTGVDLLTDIFVRCCFDTIGKNYRPTIILYSTRRWMDLGRPGRGYLILDDVNSLLFRTSKRRKWKMTPQINWGGRIRKEKERKKTHYHYPFPSSLPFSFFSITNDPLGSKSARLSSSLQFSPYSRHHSSLLRIIRLRVKVSALPDNVRASAAVMTATLLGGPKCVVWSCSSSSSSPTANSKVSSWNHLSRWMLADQKRTLHVLDNLSFGGGFPLDAANSTSLVVESCVTTA